MSTETISLIVGWLPLVIFIGLFLYLTKRNGMQAKGPSGASLIELYEQQVAETRRMNEKLERIALALEKRAGA